MVRLSDSPVQPFAGAIDEDEPPDLQGWGWNTHHPREYDCGTTAATAWRQPTGETESLPGEDRFAYVLTAPDEYLLTHGIREIDVPRYCCDFKDEFGIVITEWTIRRRGRALGIDATLLEQTVRLAEGKGRIDHDELSLYLCENRTLLARLCKHDTSCVRQSYGALRIVCDTLLDVIITAHLEHARAAVVAGNREEFGRRCECAEQLARRHAPDRLAEIEDLLEASFNEQMDLPDSQ
jgi:hypothetical protein